MRQRLKESGKYDDDPDVCGQHDNPAITYVWRLLNDAAMTPTAGGGMTRPYLSQADITAYQTNMRVTLDPLFIRALLMASRVQVNARTEHEQELEKLRHDKPA